MSLIAGMPGLPLVVLALTAPTIVVMLWLAYRFAETPGQRLTNLICGFAFSVAATIVLAAIFNPRPNSWAEQNYVWFIVAIAPIGAALGIAVSVGVRLMASRRPTTHGR